MVELTEIKRTNPKIKCMGPETKTGNDRSVKDFIKGFHRFF